MEIKKIMKTQQKNYKAEKHNVLKFLDDLRSHNKGSYLKHNKNLYLFTLKLVCD